MDAVTITPRRGISPALLHGGGFALLAVAWASGHELDIVGQGHVGHEPAIAYLLALITFLLASGGAAFAVLGPRLFQRVIVADRWLPHVPAAFREHDKSAHHG